MLEVYRSIKQQIQHAQFQQAVHQAQEALEAHPNDLELLYLCAVAQRFSKQADNAISTINRLLAISPTHGRAHQEAGYCHLALGDKNTAKQAFHLATVANPSLLSAWQQLKNLIAKDTEEAQKTVQQIQYLSALPKPLLGAMDLLHEGKYALAEQVCRQYLKQDKHHPDGMCLLADIGIKTKVYDDAVFLLETCIELHPHYQPAKIKWAELLNTLGQHHRAMPIIRDYVEKHSADNMAKSILATSWIGIGDINKGIAIYQDILRDEPHRAGIHLQLGHALKAQGDFEQAIAFYQKAYQLKPDFGDAYWSLANTKTYRFTDKELKTMQQFADQEQSESLDRIQFCFALAKAHEDNRDYDSAFHYYELGNKLKAKTVGYDPDYHSMLVDLQLEHCDKSLFADNAGGNTSEAPVFIVGLPRAGSTLIEQILSSHSKVDATMELHNVLGMAMKLRGRMTNETPAYPANLHSLTEQQFTELGNKFIEDTQHYRQGAPYFIDKMPNNFLHIGLIKKILPNAKIIDARREPMACCFSGFKQLFGEGQEFSYNLTSIGRYYADYVRLMNHWNKVLPGFVLQVNHEEVVDDLEGQVRRLLDFCGLPFEQACIDFHLNKRAIKTPSSEQVRQPIYRSGMQQWTHFEPYLQPLKTALEK